MLTHEHQLRFGGNGPRLRAPSSSLLGRILAGIVSAAALIVVFMLSIVVFAAVAAVAVVAGTYVWWKTRALRRQLRERPPGGHIIEGEVIRDTRPGDTTPR
jgi:hypothetical protein